MKICVFGPSYPLRGGIAHYTSLFCNALRERSHDVKLITFKRLYPRFLFPGKTEKDTSGTPIRSDAEPVIDSMNPLTWLAAGKRMRAFRPDLVVIQWWHPMFAPQYATVARFRPRGSRLVFLCHNVIPHESAGPMQRLARMALRHGDHFIVHSEEDRRNLIGLVPGADVTRSRHPTYEVFNTGVWDRDACRRELGLDGNVILFFGLVRRYKGLIHLIQAMPKVLSRIDATLLIVGEFYDKKEPYLEEIRKLGVSDRALIVDEYVPNEEVGRYFTAADVAALPYVSATQSGIVQIAFGFNKPVIATSVGGLPDVIEHGETGLLTPPEDPDALADAIIDFFAESRGEQFSRNIAARQDEFSWGRMVDVVEGLGTEG
ncbi:MAG: glycosyltransferase [Armatimonadota bacterium]|nr:glycosyltransferase [Armatimonadota bacterium]